ncbi:hypothetical protein [uncultured Oscillibacter sp.]|uniref:hypothetical protein n=1 Tax=uncultured Oscillibacter sp. TaxID=876091 RepID=UPI0025EA949D|nr:hypothetical protein [uncultured Oscillibacter sp.]
MIKHKWMPGCILSEIMLEDNPGTVFSLNRRAQPDQLPAATKLMSANEPLTLDELRGMDGEPVKIDDDGATLYGLVSLSGNCFTHDEVITLCNGNFYQFADISGNVRVYPIAYRRKPEREGGNL